MKKKGRLSKLLSVVVSAAMALSCFSSVAFADDENNEGSTKLDRTFEIYQIFTATTIDGKFASIKWGVNGSNNGSSVTVGNDVPETIKKEISDLATSNDDVTKLATIEKYVSFSSPAYSETEACIATITKSKNKYTISGLPVGYYLIRDKSDTQSGENQFYTLSVVEASEGKDVIIEIKGDAPSVQKLVAEDGTDAWEETATASYGGTVNFKLTASLPSEIEDYKTYYLKFSDTLSKGLTFTENSIKVYYNTVADANEITDYFFKSVGTYSETNETDIAISIKDLKRIENLTYLKTEEGGTSSDVKMSLKDAEIIVTYSATLNEYAVLKDGNPNTVHLVYSNDPNNSGTAQNGDPEKPGDDPNYNPNPDQGIPTAKSTESEVNVYTTALQITKYGGSYDNIVTGATFELSSDGLTSVVKIVNTYEKIDANEGYTGQKYYKVDNLYTTSKPDGYSGDEYKLSSVTVTTPTGTDNNLTATVGPDGILTFWGLGTGKYTLKETVSPDGYNRIQDTEFTIHFTDGEFYTTGNSSIAVLGEDELYDGIIYFDCLNPGGAKLPTTGGIGTTIFYVVGTILVLGAGVALVVRRRMRKETSQV